MIERKPVVLVTGASGFVGRHVVPMLAREGWSVRRAVRMAEGLDGEVVIPSIGPDTVWHSALADVDASSTLPRASIISVKSTRPTFIG